MQYFKGVLQYKIPRKSQIQCSQWRCRRDKWGDTCPGVRPWGRINTLFAV